MPEKYIISSHLGNYKITTNTVVNIVTTERNEKKLSKEQKHPSIIEHCFYTKRELETYSESWRSEKRNRRTNKLMEDCERFVKNHNQLIIHKKHCHAQHWKILIDCSYRTYISPFSFLLSKELWSKWPISRSLVWRWTCSFLDAEWLIPTKLW